MHTYRCEVAEGYAETLFDTAVYRFLELHGAPEDSLVTVHTEPQRSGCVKSVRLWSREAVERFDRHWRAFVHERAGCRPFPLCEAA